MPVNANEVRDAIFEELRSVNTGLCLSLSSEDSEQLRDQLKERQALLRKFAYAYLPCSEKERSADTLEDFQLISTRTYDSEKNLQDLVLESALGLSGEAGEVADLLKKSIFHGHELDKEKLSKELGDVLWYVSSLATLYGLSLTDIANQNIEKLLKRYPEGFSKEASRNRQPEGE